MTKDEERQAFLDRIKEDPYDSTNRLIFADWLEEHGNDRDEEEILEQRRKATTEWIAADKWMHNLAGTLGETCVNYDQTYVGYDGHEEEEWIPITYEDCIRAGYDCLETGCGFTQIGSERARDKMYEKGAKEEFWNNWQIITGIYPDASILEEIPFSCSC